MKRLCSTLCNQKKADLAPVEGSEYASEVARLCLQVVMNMTYRCKEAQVRVEGRSRRI